MPGCGNLVVTDLTRSPETPVPSYRGAGVSFDSLPIELGIRAGCDPSQWGLGRICRSACRSDTESNPCAGAAHAAPGSNSCPEKDCADLLDRCRGSRLCPRPLPLTCRLG